MSYAEEEAGYQEMERMDAEREEAKDHFDSECNRELPITYYEAITDDLRNINKKD